MKKITTLTLAILSITLYAQNWKPMNSWEKFNYKYSDFNYITHTLWVDSADNLGGDSTYYLNRVVTDDGVTSYPDYLLWNQPQFLMRKVEFTNQGIYTFQDTNSFTINTFAHVGETWDYNTSGVTAEIIEQNEAIIFGQTDSLKTILLSTGDTIKLSKNHGILLFPGSENNYYRLVGMEEREMGELVPDFNDFFSFEIDDVFQYEIEEGYAADYFYNTLKKITILDQWEEPGAKFYKVRSIARKMNYEVYPYPVVLDTIYYNSVDTISFSDSLMHYANRFNNELVKISGGFFNHLYSYLQFSEFNDRFAKILPGEGNNAYTIDVEAPLKPSNVLMPADAYFKKKYALGLGNVHQQKSINEYDYIKELIGYIKEGNTTGTVYSDSYLLGMKNDNTQKSSIEVFPNPAFDKVYIKGLRKLDLIRITNIQGHVLFEEKAKRNRATILIPLDSYASGIYFISIIHGNNIFNKKIMVAN